jgi:nickel/cobalt exporter
MGALRLEGQTMRAKRPLPPVCFNLLVVIGLLVLPPLAWAHPLGNFSISHYAALRLEPDALLLRYVIDMAEIPTFQELQDTKIAARQDDPGLPAYLAQRVEALRSGLILELDGRRLPLDVASSAISFPPGAGGLPTLRLDMRLQARLNEGSATGHVLFYRDANFPWRAGWKEVIARAGEGIMLVSSSAPEQDRSQALLAYPTDPLNSPPQDVEARIEFIRYAGREPLPIALGGVQPPLHPVRLEINRPHTARSSFTELVTAQQLSLGMVLVAVVVSVGLGAFHALEPGHGKAVVAAYLVGSRGTAWHAMLLGLIVTLTHTVGVYLLGAVTLFASHYVLPERLYPWLGTASGLIIAALGFTLFLRRYAAAGVAHGHHHDHVHPHDHRHGHRHGPDASHTPAHEAQAHHHHAPSGASWRELLALGVTGGIVPCPAALVVLLSALSMRRVGFGLLLILAFSAGLAAVLIAIGILMVSARRLMSRLQGDGMLTRRWLPLTSAAVMTVFGIAIAVQALIAADILQVQL